METDISTALIQNVDLDELLNQRASMLKRIEQAITLLKETQAVAEQAQLEMLRFSMSTHQSDEPITHYIPEGYCLEATELMQTARKFIDVSAWQYLMKASDLHLFMDETNRREWKE